MISKNQIKYVHQLEQKKFRKAENLFIAEGHKVVGDLIAAGYRPTQLFATREWLSEHPYDATYIEVTNDELARLSLQQHPQQVLALFPIPEAGSSAALQGKELSILLDNVQDPGNLGTIIRIADWFGISTINGAGRTVDGGDAKPIGDTDDGA